MFDHQNQSLARTDPEVWDVIARENQRQEAHIELIASENYTSPAVLQAVGRPRSIGYGASASGRTSAGFVPAFAGLPLKD